MGLRIRDWQVMLPVCMMATLIEAAAYIEAAGIRDLAGLILGMRNWEQRAFFLALTFQFASLYCFWVWRDLKTAPSSGV